MFNEEHNAINEHNNLHENFITKISTTQICNFHTKEFQSFPKTYNHLEGPVIQRGVLV
jgi:hypothetical protein